jgi:hypothetical protein
MNSSNKNLIVIIPTTRGEKSIPTLSSAFSQNGFDRIIVIVTGKSTLNSEFRSLIKNKFKTEILYIAECRNKKNILPGEARNDGLKYILDNNLDAEYVLFVDDDIILSKKYGETLADFMKKNDSCAVMGRISSFPVNFWTKIIDYSNFWWLQMEKNVINRKWLGAGATLTKYDYLKDIYFEENAAVNEDVIFFSNISKKTSKPLSVCAETKCEHHHNRKNVIEFIKYQFNNGKRGVLFHRAGIHPIRAVISIGNNFRVAFFANRNFLKKNLLVTIGVILSFFIFEIGIQTGSFLLFLKKNKRKDIY